MPKTDRVWRSGVVGEGAVSISERMLAGNMLTLLTLPSQGTKNPDERVGELYFEIKALTAKSKLVPVMPTKVN
jgi:hypothetical protein